MAKKRVKVPVRSEEETRAEHLSREQGQHPSEEGGPLKEADKTAAMGEQTQASAGAEAPTQEIKPEEAEETLDPEALKAEMTKLKQELEHLRSEAETYKDRYLRAVAEMDNMRKRLEKHYADEARREKQRFLRTILPLVDHLEMVVKHSGSDPKILHQGVQMILQDLMRTLEMEGVKPIRSVGERFDPFVHEAVEVVETTDVPPDTVVDEVQRGYTYQGELLRPARVRVARAPSTEKESADNGAERAEG